MPAGSWNKFPLSLTTPFLKNLRKLSLVTLGSLKLSGNEFQVDGPATEKALHPRILLFPLPFSSFRSSFSQIHLGGLGETCELLQQGLGRKLNLMHFK